MAAPTPTVRVVPSGYKMPDGYRSLITLAEDPAIQFWEKQIKPPGIDGGDGIDTTTMLNTTWRTKAPRQLKTMTECTLMAAYDPDVLTAIIAMVNFPTVITVQFSDKSTLCFYGFIQKFEPGELKEGEFPEATVTLTPTNWDYNGQVEAGPVFTPAAGT